MPVLNYLTDPCQSVSNIQSKAKRDTKTIFEIERDDRQTKTDEPIQFKSILVRGFS